MIVVGQRTRDQLKCIPYPRITSEGSLEASALHRLLNISHDSSSLKSFIMGNEGQRVGREVGNIRVRHGQHPISLRQALAEFFAYILRHIYSYICLASKVHV